MNWRACLDPHAEHLEINASHIGMAVLARAWRAVAAALAEFREAGSEPRGGRKAVTPARKTAAPQPARLRRAA